MNVPATVLSESERRKTHDRYHDSRRGNGRNTANKKRARDRGLVKISSPMTVLVVMMSVVMPVVVPTDFSRRDFRAVLDRSDAGRIGQR